MPKRAATTVLGPGPWCGTDNGYTYHRCRCTPCKEARRVAHRAYVERTGRTASGGVVGPGPWCGTAGGYTNHDCRCERCTEAWRVSHVAYMHRTPEQRERNRRRTAEKRGGYKRGPQGDRKAYTA